MKFGVLAQELRHLASRIDALFHLAVQLQNEIGAVVDDGKALVGLLRSGLQIRLDRSPGLAELTRVRAYQLAGIAADTPPAHDCPQERVAEVAIEGCRVKNCRSFRPGAVQPGQDDIGMIVQNRLGLVTGRNGYGYEVDLRIAVAIVDAQKKKMRSGFRQVQHPVQFEPGDVALLTQEPRAGAQHSGDDVLELLQRLVGEDALRSLYLEDRQLLRRAADVERLLRRLSAAADGTSRTRAGRATAGKDFR